MDVVLDRLVHEPARLALMSVLAYVGDADFVFLQRATELTKGNLSSHLAKLDEAGLVRIDKRYVDKRPSTKVELTAKGRKAIERHWEQLDRLKRLATSRRPTPS